MESPVETFDYFKGSLRKALSVSRTFPLTMEDLDAASRWDVYIVSSKQLLLLKEVKTGEGVKTVNGKADLVKPLNNPTHYNSLPFKYHWLLSYKVELNRITFNTL